jgi:hypothetical protein
MSAFQDDSEARYVLSLVKFLQDEVPGAAGDDAGYLVNFVKSMVKRAEGYELTTRRDVAVYVTTAYMLGEDFEEHFHVAKEILTASLPGCEKASRLQTESLALIDSRGRTPR